jgi:hypothetical protein
MFALARILRIASGVLAAGALLLAVWCAYVGLSDYAMQHREHWDRYCADVWLNSGLVCLVSIGIAITSLLAYRKSTAWEHRLHTTRAV